MYIVTKSWNDFKRLGSETVVTNPSGENNLHLNSHTDIFHLHLFGNKKPLRTIGVALRYPEDSGSKVQLKILST